MKALDWNRAEVIEWIKEDVWRYLKHAPTWEDAMFDAAALLQMEPHEVRTLAQIHFIASAEVERLLDEMPTLARNLTTTTVAEPETSVEHVRGAVRWGETFAGQATMGLPNLHVTTPARRAHDTAENAVLAFALGAIREVGQQPGLARASSGAVVATGRKRAAQAEHWLQTRSLANLRPAQPAPNVLARVRSGRAARRYRAALDVIDLHSAYVGRLDRVGLREAIERHALVTSKDPVLFELLCAFRVERALQGLGWVHFKRPGLVASGPFLSARRGDSELELHYQRAPPELLSGAVYDSVLKGHEFTHVHSLKPDLSMAIRRDGVTRWAIFEVKGVGREARGYATAALRDLLAYRRAFAPALDDSEPPYGVGIAWGSELVPARDREVLLCTPEKIEEALTVFLGDASP